MPSSKAARPGPSRQPASSKAQWQQSDSESDAEVEAEDVDEATKRRPTFAQFQGESEEEEELDSDDEDDSDESSEEEDADTDDGQEQQIRQKLASIPFSALLKAKKATPANDTDEEDFSEEDEWAEDRAKASMRKGKAPVIDEAKRQAIRQTLRAGQAEDDGRPSSSYKARNDEDDDEQQRHRNDPQKRTNKHAPAEVSSRRPVSRKRSVIESASSTSKDLRDPRFSNLSGPSVNAGLFSTSYSFLPSMQSEELVTLKKNLSRLRKLEAHQAGPKARSEQALQIREEREEVERALKRAEAKDAERKRREREREVMSKFKKENDERVAKGGSRFYLKDKDKKELMLKDKFERLAGGNKGKARAGGNSEVESSLPSTEPSNSRALRKALDKRRKKNAAKERKNMPFLVDERRGAAGGSAPLPARKRLGSSNDGGSNQKRRRA